MLAAHREEINDPTEKRNLQKSYAKTLLELALQWNSVEGVKQLLRDIKEPEQVSNFLEFYHMNIYRRERE